MTKLLIFDFDGVIISGSNQGYFTCYHKALESVGIVLEPEDERKKILEKWGKGYKIQIEYLLNQHQDLIPKALESYEKCYYSPLFEANIKLIKGADTSLQKLSEKYNLAIASGMMTKTLEKYLNQFNIKKHFKYVLSSDEIKNPEDKKPSPFMLNMVLKHFQEHNKNAVYIGDGPGDVEMAVNAEIEPIVVLTGHLSEEETKNLGVKKIIKDINYLEDVLG